jgi:hypothetical protein
MSFVNVFKDFYNSKFLDFMKSIVPPDTQGSLDVFNYVGEETRLSYQNVAWLMSNAFEKSGKDADFVEHKMFNTIAVISEDQSLDTSLRDEILKFIGREPALDRASIALVRGRVNPSKKQIEGDTHWTALHLRRSTSANGQVVIQAFHMDSLGGGVPSAVTRVLTNINKTKLENLTPDLKESEPHKRAIRSLSLGNITFKQPEIKKCNRQKNWYSCGYDTVFNLVRMYDSNGALNQDIQQDDVTRNVNQFIAERKIDLQKQFNNAVSQAKRSSKIISESNKSSDTITGINDLDTAIACVFLIVDSKLSHIEKLKELIKIEQQLRTNQVLLLSALKIEESYGKVIGEFSESIRFSFAKKLQEVVGAKTTTNLELLLQFINAAEIRQNPEKIIPFLEQLEILFKNLEKIADPKDKNLLQLPGLLNQIAKNKKDFLEKIGTYTNDLKAVNKLLSQNQVAAKSPAPNPTPPITAETAINLDQAKKEGQELIKPIIAAQKYNPRPEFPYQGIGLASKVVTRYIESQGNLKMLKITEDFNREASRFKNKSGLEIDLVGQYITGGKYEDPNNKGNFISFNIDKIFKEENDKQAAMKRIAGIFHDEGKIKLEVIDSFGNKNEIEYERSEEDVYVTRRCKFLNTATISNGKNGAQYDLGIHGSPPVAPKRQPHSH